ncbi:MAG: undecaprenyldiphospho-muramoylpentapeptide beta-N-acetylglucosaminyltransferase [Proteobacteria bacterium]|nr:undecaprenyldiphospho-muramoylpentapeptide beta-N-acetylglucosaminyltransferase [Pseudomonadota bacterium]
MLVIVTGGGTGGHAIPAMILIKEFLRRNCDVLYVGSEGGVETKIIVGLCETVFLKVGGVKGKSFLSALKGLFLIFISFLKMLIVFLKRRPSFIIGVGGFVSVASLMAGLFLRIPFYLQEQNAVPGTATKFFAPFAKRIFLGFEDITSSLPSKKSVITGNPIREDFLIPFNYKTFTENEKMKIFILGGSRGSKFINQLIIETLPLLNSEKFFFIHQTGKDDKERIRRIYEEYGFEGEVFDFSSNISGFYRQSHFIISRAGAMTVTEIMYLKIPALFIPYPYAIYDHQAKNAEFAKKIGCAMIYRENEVNSNILKEILNDLYVNPQKLREMSKRAENFKLNNPAKKIIDTIWEDLCIKAI